jgi:hypothetical protein
MFHESKSRPADLTVYRRLLGPPQLRTVRGKVSNNTRRNHTGRAEETLNVACSD